MVARDREIIFISNSMLIKYYYGYLIYLSNGGYTAEVRNVRGLHRTMAIFDDLFNCLDVSTTKIWHLII